MGWQISWAAVRGKPREEVWRDLGFRPTGRTDDVPTAPFSSTLLGEWVLVLAHRDDRFSKDRVLAPLSRGADVVGCFAEEHVMFVEAVAWTDGRQRWTVKHSAEQGLDNLESQGDPPRLLETLVAAARRKRDNDPDGADFFFEVPGELARSIVGFKHDDFGDDLRFEELEPERPLARWAIRNRRWLTWLKVIGALGLVALALRGCGIAARAIFGN
jgi:hypothetical protein